MTISKQWTVAVLAIAALVGQVAMAQPVPVRIPIENRPINLSPTPVTFVSPGLTGIYSLLRADAAASPTAPAPPARPVRPGPVLALARYVPYASPATPPDASKFNIGQIVVKFVEGSAIRLRNGALVASTEPAALRTQSRLGRSGLEPAAVITELQAFNTVVQKSAGVVGRATPQVEEGDLLLLSQRAELNTQAEQPDLNLFYYVYLKKIAAEPAFAILNNLRKSKIVEAAYFQPIPFDASDIPPLTTIDVTSAQGYFMPAPTGIDVNYARLFAGGRGADVRIADIEGGWDTEHEDLPPMAFGFGTNWGAEHGTAVLGELAAQENGYGANGIAPNAMVGWSSVTNLDPFMTGGVFYFYSVANALLVSGNALRPGDIALIEQHFPNLFAGACPNTCNCPQFGYVAVETVPFEHAAISSLTGSGIIVVEAAGNGQTLVTPASTRDSGAIVVGASDSGGAGVPACFTNFGPRVNVRAWGDSIGSDGYGDDPTLQANGNDNRQWYTKVFSGTSGASPIVTGAAALIQSTRSAVGQSRLNSVQMRTLLVSTGVPQSGGVAIGPQPDLRKAIGTYIPDLAMFVSQTAAPGTTSPGSNFNVTETFQNSGGSVWTGDHTMAITPGSGAMVWQPQSASLGTTAIPVMPGSNTVKSFAVKAPTTPGTYRLVFAVTNSAGQILAVSPAQTIVVVAPGATTFDNASLTLVVPGSLVSGASAPGSAIITNTGTSTWGPGYQLSLSRLGRISLPVNNVPVTGTVLPGKSITLNFTVMCNGSGLGGITVQMGGTSGAFGQSVGQNVSCQ